MSPSRLRRPAILVLLLLGFSPSASTAFSITDVLLMPTGTILPSDSVQLTIGITTPALGAFLFAPTTLSQNGNDFVADIFIDDRRNLFTEDFIEETVALGMLNPGTYSYLIRLTPAYDVNWGVREVSGSFSVVPLPSTLILLLAALVSLTGFKTGRMRFC